jgi:signal transduction histidine kinase
MSRSRSRLSLRTRMLVLMLSVASAFLLVMGTVSTIFIAGHLAALFTQNLETAATYSPDVLATSTSGYAAVQIIVAVHPHAIPRLTVRAVNPLTVKTPGTQELAAAVRQMASDRTLAAHLLDRRAFAVPQVGNGPRLRGAAARHVPGVFVIVAQPVSILIGQIREFIIAELITGGALIALLAVGGERLIGAGLDPLDRMAVTANEITSRGDLTARMPDASDGTEAGRLGSAINTMLDRIQQAFGARQRSEQRVREFAADASHELRTPLTTIRGYAELYRQGALGPDQLPSAMRRIEQEAQRMSTLVAELLELARLDRTTSLDLTESDLAGVVRDAVADAVAVEPDRPVRAEAPPRLVAVVDERRIRQVLANLLGNVRTHTPVSTPVAVRLGEVTGGVLIEVADAGPGMSGEDAARAFDRFHRAPERPGTNASDRNPDDRNAADRNDGDRNDGAEWAHDSPSLNGHGAAAAGGLAGRGAGGHDVPGPAGHETGPDSDQRSHPDARHGAGGGRRQVDMRERGSKERGTGGGSGLGLSIVQAIAAAHGGKATLESWPGRGTRVRIWLPTRTAP